MSRLGERPRRRDAVEEADDVSPVVEEDVDKSSPMIEESVDGVCPIEGKDVDWVSGELEEARRKWDVISETRDDGGKGVVGAWKE